MKATNISRLLLALATLCGVVQAQGPLDPPTTGGGPGGPVPPLAGGNPQPAMKTLHQVEPRTPVSDATTPGNATFAHIISAPGSYYLTNDILLAGKSGIHITATDVTLDLNGFSIRTPIAVPSGILIGNNADRCVIRNGSISGPNFGINRTLNASDEAAGGSFENLTVSGQSNIGLLGGNGWTVTNCRVHGGRNSGIVVGTGSVPWPRVVRFPA